MGNIFIIGVVAIVIGVFVFIYGGENFSNNPSSVVEVPFTELAKGIQSDVKTRTNYLITSVAELEKLWGMIDTEEKLPSIDFEKSLVAAVFYGQKMTGGYEISVSKVLDSDVRMVIVDTVSPGVSCIVTQSTTAPYQVVELSKTSIPFSHEDNSTTENCKE